MEKLNTKMTRAELQGEVKGLRNQLNLSKENSRLKHRLVSAQPMVDAQPATAPLVVETNKRGSKHNRRGSTGLGLVAGAVIGATAALALSGGVRFGGGFEPTGSSFPTTMASTRETIGSTPRPSEAAGTPSLVPTQRAEALASSSAKPEASQSVQSSLTNPASKDASGNWIVKNPDGKAETVSTVDGFTPDTALVLAPEYGKTLPIEPATFADFQKSLNDPKHPLVGYTYGENDQSDNLNYKRTLQVPMYSWTVATGLEVDAPGIGHLVGGPGRAVELMIMNIDGSVGAFGSDNPILIKDGFTGTGRIWDGKNVIEDERGISSHYVSRLQNGVTLPGESGFIGQCDIATNCNQVLVVSVVRTQWGLNSDGSKRFQYQLLREEIVNK
jgi:hypothetical protein